MPSITDTVDARLDAVLAAGRGADGALGPLPLERSIPAARFRRILHSAPLQGEVSVQLVDRAYETDWESAEDRIEPRDTYDGRWLEDYEVALRVAYVYGDAAAAALNLAAGTSEAATYALRRVKARALNDAARIVRALTCLELLQAGGDDPEFVNLIRDGKSVFEPPQANHIVCVTPLRITLGLDPTKTYDP